MILPCYMTELLSLAAYRSEKYSSACVRCTQCPHGYEYYIKREEGDSLDRVAYQLCTRMRAYSGEWVGRLLTFSG